MGEAVLFTLPLIGNVTTAGAMAAASTLASVVGAIGQGQAAKANAAFERQQYEEESENNRVAALQDENLRRRQLAETMASQEAYFAANGLDPNSPTAAALREETIGLAEADIATAKLNFANRQRRNQLAAAQSDAAGDAAVTGSYFKAAGSLFDFGSKWKTIGGTPDKTLDFGSNLAKYGR